MPMSNLREYSYCSNNFSKASGHSWQYYRDEATVTDAGVIDDFHGNSALFKFKEKITGKTEDDSTQDVKMMMQLKYLSNF